MCLESAVVPPGIYTRHCGNLAGLYWGFLAHLPPSPAPQTVGPSRGGRAFICVSMSVSLVHDMHSVNVWWMNVSLTTTSEIPWANRNTCYFLSLWVPNSGQLGHTNVESTRKKNQNPWGWRDACASTSWSFRNDRRVIHFIPLMLRFLETCWC